MGDAAVHRAAHLLDCMLRELPAFMTARLMKAESNVEIAIIGRSQASMRVIGAIG